MLAHPRGRPRGAAGMKIKRRVDPDQNRHTEPLLLLNHPALLFRRAETHAYKTRLVRTRRRKKMSGANGVAISANCFHSFATASSVHLFQDSTDMILHGKLGEIKVRSDFLICQTLSDESNQLLLA